MKNYKSLIIAEWQEYKLLDSGMGRKLELFKDHILDQPEPRATWEKNLSYKLWQSADAIFKEDGKGKGAWEFRIDTPLDFWINTYRSIKFKGQTTPFGHVGYFPDKQGHWDVIYDYVSQRGASCKILNLFGYTGVASLIAASNGAEVVHVDSSKKAIAWAKENQQIANLENQKIRFILDDAVKFVGREVKRGAKYDLIMLDPPVRGYGINNEVWSINKDLTGLLENCKKLLNTTSSLLILNTYSAKISHVELGKICKAIFAEQQAIITTGELAICEENAKRIITQSQFSIVEYGKS